MEKVSWIKQKLVSLLFRAFCRKEKTALVGVISGIVVIALSIPAAWLTHIIYCFQQQFWGFLIAGAIFFPIAVVHGFYLWFNWIF